MSDRYRPPSGPKGPRGNAPPPAKNGWKGSSSKNYYNEPLPNRYKERDNYRPNLIEKHKQPQAPSEGQDRPAGPSAYKENYSQKRAFQDARYLNKEEYGNKRRDFSVKDHKSEPVARDAGAPKPAASAKPTAPSRQAPPSRPSGPSRPGQPRQPDQRQQDQRQQDQRQQDQRKQDRPKPRPQGPPLGPQDRKFAAKKKAPVPVNKKPVRLRPLQMYLLYSMRATDLYQRVQQVGEGTYGKVYKAINPLTKEFVALKRLRLESEREGFPITALREIKLLQSFDHPNIVGLFEMMVEHNLIFMILDYLDHDLTGLLAHPDLNLTEGHRKMMFKQLMEGMNYLHKRRVIHRDIKGSNILLNNKGIVKVADFGLARTMKVLNDGESPDYTNRVITIWYRPPELLLGSTDYGREVDIWGVGCLLMELYTRNATFQGVEELSQLFKIFEIMGTPSIESWPGIENLPWFEMLKPRINRRSRFEEDFKLFMTEDSFDLALKLLTLVPSQRLTAEEALSHPYFHNDPKPEPLTFMETLEGEWHEFETKKRRRDERKRLADLKAAGGGKGRDISLPPTQPGAPKTADNSTLRSVSRTPYGDDMEVDNAEFKTEAVTKPVELAEAKDLKIENGEGSEHPQAVIGSVTATITEKKAEGASGTLTSEAKIEVPTSEKKTE